MVGKGVLAASALAAAVNLVPLVAHAATIAVRLSEAGYGSSTASLTGDTLVVNQAFGDFTTNIEVGALSENPLMIDLGSTNFSSATAGSLTVEVTAYDLTAPVGWTDFTLQLSGHQVFGSEPGSVSVAAYLDAGNTPFGTATLLGSSGAMSLPAYFWSASSASLTAPFSVTEALTITANGPSGFSLDASLTDGVPEAPTWALMSAGFGGLGLVAFGRKRKAPVSAIG